MCRIALRTWLSVGLLEGLGGQRGQVGLVGLLAVVDWDRRVHGGLGTAQCADNCGILLLPWLDDIRAVDLVGLAVYSLVAWLGSGLADPPTKLFCDGLAWRSWMAGRLAAWLDGWLVSRVVLLKFCYALLCLLADDT